MATNKARRHRLAEIAKAKLSYQEFLEDRDYLDKAINQQYTKLQKKDVPKPNKKKKQKSEPNGVTNGAPTATGIPPPPAALGLVPDEGDNLTVPDPLKTLVDARKKWDKIGEMLVQEYRGPGQLVGLPQSSIFEGIEEEVKRELERLGPLFKPEESSSSSGSSSKGKGKARANS